MSDGWNIALLGATGAVGNAVLELLAERQFPVGELYLLASENSAGETLRFDGRSLRVENAADFDWSQAQLAFFVAGRDASARYAEEAASAGCLVIDSSDCFALSPDVPLVVPDVNPQVLADYRNRNLVSVADSLTSQLLSAIKPLVDAAGLGRLQVTNLLSVSSHGKSAVDGLAGESARLLNGVPAEEHFFGRQLAFNLLPQLADAEGSVASERRLVEQVRKVLQDDGLPIAVTSVQAPVFFGDSFSVSVQMAGPVDLDAVNALLEAADSIELVEAGDYPTAVGDAVGQDVVYVGRVRHGVDDTSELNLWLTSDNVRKGAALNAVQVAELLIKDQL